MSQHDTKYREDQNWLQMKNTKRRHTWELHTQHSPYDLKSLVGLLFVGRHTVSGHDQCKNTPQVMPSVKPLLSSLKRMTRTKYKFDHSENRSRKAVVERTFLISCTS
ncbi:hypothetical protein CEXT_170431 [Caerostris extrusa]|uniref:Uncharacterized protein n=1 Tax=Caerostris extrusa TaxID=172846 RepID=A0AAV4M9Z4_CAEEX|nr:hypothetical protein CEXT_170431 [Caerostris extrusa]